MKGSVMKVNRKSQIDESIKCMLNIEAKNIKASSKIFDVAWDNRNKENSKETRYRAPFKSLAVGVCLVLMFITMLTIVSPATKAIALDVYENIRTIFVLNDENTVVSELEDSTYEFENLGSISINSSNKAKIEKNLGFTFSFPETIDETYQLQGNIKGGITIFDVRLMDIENNRDRFLSAIEDNDTYNSLDDFKMNRSVCAHYSDSAKGNFIIYINKHRLDLFPKMRVIEEVALNENIQCKVVESTRALYPWKTE